MIRKELSGFHALDWQPQRGGRPFTARDHYFQAWRKGHGVIQHEEAVSDQALAWLPELIQQGAVRDSESWFYWLHQLDVLTSQAAWLVLHLVSMNRLSDEEEPITVADLKKPAAGELVGALSWVPTCAAMMAMNTLSGHARDWLADTPDAIPALEVLSLLLGVAYPKRRKAYPLTAVGLSRLVRAFGESSPGLLKPGPWVSPELVGARFPATHDVRAQLQQGVLSHESVVGLLSGDEAIHDTPHDADQDRNLICWMTDDHQGSVSRSDPTAILLAMLHQSDCRTEEHAGVRLLYIPLVKTGWFGELDNHRGTVNGTAECEWLTQLSRQLGCPESAWRCAADSFTQPRRGFRPLVITANRPEPHWLSKPSSPVLSLDRYWADLAEVNPRHRRCLSVTGVNREDTCPDSSELFEYGDLRDTRLVDSPDGCWALNACLGNQSGLNLVIGSDQSCAHMLPTLLTSLAFTEAQTLDDDPAPWLGLPLVTVYQRVSDMSLSSALIQRRSELVRVMLPPDANTAIHCLKTVYGLPGMVVQLCVPDDTVPVLSPEQAVELVNHGAVCLHGHCASDIQLVACGGFALQDARMASEHLKQQGIAHSLVYILEPVRIWGFQAEISTVSSLFPDHVHQRVLISDLGTQAWPVTRSDLQCIHEHTSIHRADRCIEALRNGPL